MGSASSSASSRRRSSSRRPSGPSSAQASARSPSGKVESALEAQAEETIPIGGAGLIVVYDHKHAEPIEAAVTRAIKKAIGEATDSHVKAVKAALADASAKMAGGA